jgi:hypothetical protein
MGSLPVFWLSVTCCLICVLCRDAVGESTKVVASINDAFEAEDARSMLDRENARLIRTRAGPDDITLKDDWSKFEVPQDSPLASETSSSSGKARCSRYVNCPVADQWIINIYQTAQILDQAKRGQANEIFITLVTSESFVTIMRVRVPSR